MSDKEIIELRKAAKLLIKISKRDFGVCEEYCFHCISCDTFDLATKFYSFINFYIDLSTEGNSQPKKKTYASTRIKS